MTAAVAPPPQKTVKHGRQISLLEATAVSRDACLDEESLDRVFQALSHPVRRRIIGMLAERGEASYSELMRACGVEDSGTFAFHLRRL